MTATRPALDAVIDRVRSLSRLDRSINAFGDYILSSDDPCVIAEARVRIGDDATVVTLCPTRGYAIRVSAHPATVVVALPDVARLRPRLDGNSWSVVDDQGRVACDPQEGLPLDGIKSRAAAQRIANRLTAF